MSKALRFYWKELSYRPLPWGLGIVLATINLLLIRFQVIVSPAGDLFMLVFLLGIGLMGLDAGAVCSTFSQRLPTRRDAVRWTIITTFIYAVVVTLYILNYPE